MAGTGGRHGAHTLCTLEERVRMDQRRKALLSQRLLQGVDRRRSAVTIQKHWRGYVVRNDALAQQEQSAYLAIMFSCMRIQRRFREYLYLKHQREVKERDERLHLWASWVIQTVRMHILAVPVLPQHVTITLTELPVLQVARCALPQADITRRRKVAAADQRSLLMVARAIVIQKFVRGYLQRRLLLWLRPRRADARKATQHAHANDVDPLARKRHMAVAAAARAQARVY
eukprot:COSAG05_NODE_2332_length_3219_cov_8.397436_1_plen_230_part_00